MFKKYLCFLFVFCIMVGSLTVIPVITFAGENSDEEASEPSNLQITGLTTYSSQATLTWDPPSGSTGTGEYMVYVNGGKKAQVSGESYQFTDLAPNTGYTISVREIYEDGTMSEASDPLTVTTGYVTMRTVGEGQQYATIQAAVYEANPGDVVLVKDGTYIEEITIKRSGTEERYITIMAEGDNALINGRIDINASYIRLAGFKMDGYVDGSYLGVPVRIRQHYTQVVGMDIRNFRGQGIRCEWVDASHAYVADNYIYNCNYGFYTCSDSIFERNEVEYLNRHGDPGDADYIRAWGENVIVRDNYCHGTVYGPHIKDAHVDFMQSFDESGTAKNVLVENNIITGHLGQAIMLENDSNGPRGIFNISDWTVRNNVFQGFTAWGICAGKENGGIPNMTIENNLFIGTPDALYGVVFTGTGGSGTIRNNIIINASIMSYGAEKGATLSDESGNNLIYNANYPSRLQPTDIMGMDPVFVNPDSGDYHLQADSPAIDFGAEVGFKYDAEGNARPSGNGFDIGPYEFQGIKENSAPLITITSPVAAGSYRLGDPINVSVYARDDREVVKVEYFVNGNRIGESTEAPFDYTLEGIQEGIYTLYCIAYDDEELLTKSSEVMFNVSQSQAMMVGSSWRNLPIPERQGLTIVKFDAIPMADNMNGVIGVTFGEASAFGNLAAIVRFNPNGLIDSWKGGATPYTYVNQIPYSALKTYHFTMIIDIPQRLFSVLVIDEEDNIIVLAQSYPFRSTGAVGADTLNTIGGLSEAGSYVLFYNEESEYVPVENVDIEESVSMKVGNTLTLTSTILPENATVKLLTWESSKPSVATVDGNGKVTAVSAGTATITVKVAGTGIQDTCTVTAQPAQAKCMTITAPDEIAPAMNFSSTIGFNLNETILTAGLTVTYNPELLLYEGYDPIEGGLYVAGTDHDESKCEITLLLSGGEGGAITSDKALVKLNFRSKEAEGSSVIAITGAELLDVPGNSIFPEPASKTVRVNYVIPGDANEDGVINLRDLHFVSTHFWKDTNSEDWDIVKAADFNNDGHIGIEDLVYVAGKILQQ